MNNGSVSNPWLVGLGITLMEVVGAVVTVFAILSGFPVNFWAVFIGILSLSCGFVLDRAFKYPETYVSRPPLLVSMATVLTVVEGFAIVMAIVLGGGYDMPKVLLVNMFFAGCALMAIGLYFIWRLDRLRVDPE